MKKTRQCTSCQGKAFYVVDEVKSPNYEYSNMFNAVGLTGVYASSPDAGFFSGGKKRFTCTLEAWVCKGCGLTQLYAKDMDVLARVEREGKGVRSVDG